MNRTLLRALPNAFALLLASVLVPASTGCGGTVSATGGGTGGGNGTGGGHGTGGSPSCHIDPPGAAFTFHVHNGGTKMLSLSYGCGGAIPIQLATPNGMESIGTEGANNCEVTCDVAYAGNAPTGWSDCGPGQGAALGPGTTVDIAWDHRVYGDHAIDPACVKGPINPGAAPNCILGQAVPPAVAQQGSLAVCNSSMVAGYCFGPVTAVSFTIDTTKSEGTIEFM
jgi:hypothetical protein